VSSSYPIIRLTVSGQTLEYSREKLLRANLVQESNPISAELPASELEFSVISTDGSLSMFSGSLFNLLSQRLPVMAYEWVDGATVFLGKFYLDAWENVSLYEFEFVALDLIGVMQNMDFDGIFWPTPVTLQSALAQVLTAGNIPYELDSSLADVMLSGWIPPGKYRDALGQICLATGATASTAGSEVLVISPMDLPDKMPDWILDGDAKTDRQPVKLLPMVTSIEVVAHNYTQGTEIETIFEEFLEAGSHKIVFAKPYYNIVIDGPGYQPSVLATEGGDYLVTEGGDYIEAGGEFTFGPNSVYLTLSEGAVVTITGYPWVDSQKAYPFRESGVSASNDTNPKKIKDAYLVSNANAQTVLDRVRDFFRLRYEQTVTLFPSSLRLRDIALHFAQPGKRLLGTARKMEFDLSGGYLAKTVLLGVEPQYSPPVAEPARRPRTGIAICGAELTRQNLFREYAHA
jgi:hypothetical protein